MGQAVRADLSEADQVCTLCNSLAKQGKTYAHEHETLVSKVPKWVKRALQV